MRTAVAAALSALAIASPSLAGSNREDIEVYLLGASRLYESLEYERALEQLQRARALNPDDDASARIYLYEGMIYADMGDRRDQALASFRNGLMLRPDAKLPLKVSPKVEKDFDAKKKEVQAELAKARKTGGPAQSSTTASNTMPAADRPTAPVDQKATAKATLTPSRPETEPAAGGLGPSAGASFNPFEKGLPVVPTVLGGAAVGAGIGGAIFGLMCQSSQNQLATATFQSEKAAFFDQAVNQAYVANTLFITAGVAAVGATATYFLMQ